MSAVAPLRTERLLLRALRRDDAHAFTAVFGDPEVMRFGDGTKDAAWIAAWLEQRGEHTGPAPLDTQRAVLLRDGGELIGFCGLNHMPDVEGRPETEVGYRLARAHWGRGYATEAVRAVRDHALHELGLRRLVALIDPGNAASIRVAEKAGMHVERMVHMPEYTYPDRLYVIERPQGEIGS